MSYRMTMKGQDELTAALRTLGRGVPPSRIDRAAKSASTPMLTQAVLAARSHRVPGRRPRGGHLDEGIVFARKTGGSRKERSYVIGAINRARYLLHFLEWGTKPHYQPRRGSFHPGARRFPIMRPAFDAHSQGLNEAFCRHLLGEVVKMVLKANPGRARRR